LHSHKFHNYHKSVYSVISLQAAIQLAKRLLNPSPRRLSL
jgi:hypothetical protein